MWKMLKVVSQLLEVQPTHKAFKKGWISAGWPSERGRENESARARIFDHLRRDSDSLRGQSTS